MRGILLVAALGCAWCADEEPERQLLTVRRIHVERLTGGETAAQIRDMLINSLRGTKLYVLTENLERADAILRGSAEDLVFTDTFQTSEGVNARSSFGVNSGDYQRSVSSSRRGVSGSIGVGENESARIAERKHEATASVRLVNKAGDVIWSTTQESLGGKFRGASADVADKVVKQLLEDHARVKKGAAAGPTAPAAR